jgi:hypothetical protein
MRVTHRAGGIAQPAKPRSRAAAVVRWAAWLSAGIAVIGLAAAGLWWLGRAVRTPLGPDLAAFSGSAVVQTDDVRAARWLTAEGSRLTGRRVSWLTLAGHALVDECAGSGGGGGLFGGGISASVACQRTDTWYLAVVGGQRAEQGNLERILHRADGWGRFSTVPQGSASPPVMPMTTADWVGPAGPAPPAGKIGLDLIWVASRQELAAAALGSTQSQTAADRVSYLAVLRPDLASVARRSFAVRRHVLIVSIEDSYFFSTSATPPRTVVGARYGALARAKRGG